MISFILLTSSLALVAASAAAEQQHPGSLVVVAQVALLSQLPALIAGTVWSLSRRSARTWLRFAAAAAVGSSVACGAFLYTSSLLGGPPHPDSAAHLGLFVNPILAILVGLGVFLIAGLSVGVAHRLRGAV